MDADVRKLVFKYAPYAISAHNSQPFQLQVEGDEIRVRARRDRFLPAADPHGKDLRMSMGALFETLSIGLSTHNIQLEIELLLIGKLIISSEKPIAIIKWKSAALTADPLASQLPKRFSYRGVFPKGQEQKLQAAKSVLTDVGLIPITDEKMKIKFKNVFKEINLRFLLKDGYIEELYSWMRFSPKNLRWSQDGLNAESIALSPIETTGARLLMRPKVFRFLNKMGLAGVLVDESPKILSAPFLVVIPAPAEASDFDKGRLFLRAWLELTRQDLYGAPLSLLTDDAETLRYIAESIHLSPTQTIANVIRCGLLPSGFVRYAPARLSRQELEFG